MSDRDLRSTHRLDHVTLRQIIDGTAGVSSSGSNQDESVGEVADTTLHAGNIQEPIVALSEESHTTTEVSDLSLRESDEAFVDSGEGGQVPNEVSKAALQVTVDSEGSISRDVEIEEIEISEISEETLHDIDTFIENDTIIETEVVPPADQVEEVLQLDHSQVVIEEVPSVDNLVVQVDSSQVNEQVPNASVTVESSQLQVADEGSVSVVGQSIHSQIAVDITGNLVSNQPIMNTDVDKQRLVSLQESARGDITDYILENPSDELLFIDDVNSCISRIEELRSSYRSIHNDLRTLDPTEYENTLKVAYDETLREIKTFIMNTKAVKNSIRKKEVDLIAVDKRNKEAAEDVEKERKKKTADFLIKDLNRLLSGIESDIDVRKISDNRDFLSDEALIAQRTNLPSIQRRIDSLSQKYTQFLSVVPEAKGSSDKDVSEFTDRYEETQVQMIKYQDRLREEIKSRELDKEKNFKASNLQIKLPKFKGYDSTLDIYTLQDRYEKLYSATIPKRMMPEHLKNHYLEGPAFDFVKRMDDIDEIWASLKKGFGDPRVMLSKKLSELDTIGSLGKITNAEKSKDSLSKLVNVIHDLMKIAKVHKIEEKLYNGESIYTIYKVMGDAKVTRFIEVEKTYEDELKGKDLWDRLVKFLEKDIKIQLEKSMIYRSLDKSVTPKPGAHYAGGKNDGGKSNEQNTPNDQSSNKSKKDQTNCFLCNKDDHVGTKGPYGRKLIQYFSCEAFTKMTPAQRFAELKGKGLCYQCLFPGAKITAGKHVEGKCQNTYICKHESHNTHTSKKHLLVCEEHKNEEANKALLEEYRSRCITRNSNSDLPDFAKQIQLSFHCVYTSQPLPSPEDCNWDAIYMFQMIKVNGQTFMLFFDNGCGDIVMTHDAVNRLGANAKQVFDGMVSLGGVGGVGVESPYGAYEISLPLANGRNAVMSGLVIEQITNKFPDYVLDTDVQCDIITEFVKSGGKAKDLPRLLKSIGGRVDIMIGVKYLRYFPTNFSFLRVE